MANMFLRDFDPNVYRAAKIPNDGWINDYLSDDELNELRLLMLLDLEVSENDYHYNYSRLQPVILVTATTLLYLGGEVIFVEEQLMQAAKKSHLKFQDHVIELCIISPLC